MLGRVGHRFIELGRGASFIRCHHPHTNGEEPCAFIPSSAVSFLRRIKVAGHDPAGNGLEESVSATKHSSVYQVLYYLDAYAPSWCCLCHGRTGIFAPNLTYAMCMNTAHAQLGVFQPIKKMCPPASLHQTHHATHQTATNEKPNSAHTASSLKFELVHVLE